MNGIVVIPNAIPVALQDYLEELCISDRFSWYYNAHTLDPYRDNKITTPQTVEHSQFTHMVCAQGRQVSNHYYSFLGLVPAIPVPCIDVIRIKLNLSFPNLSAKENTYGAPHVDIAGVKNLITAIYYVSDSDGDTYIFNESEGNDLTVKARISPQKGTLVAFNGTHIHAGNTPRCNKPRIVVNIDIVSNKELP
jgi:hypothetical protein